MDLLKANVYHEICFICLSAEASRKSVLSYLQLYVQHVPKRIEDSTVDCRHQKQTSCLSVVVFPAKKWVSVWFLNLNVIQNLQSYVYVRKMASMWKMPEQLPPHKSFNLRVRSLWRHLKHRQKQYASPLHFTAFSFLFEWHECLQCLLRVTTDRLNLTLLVKVPPSLLLSGG